MSVPASSAVLLALSARTAEKCQLTATFGGHWLWHEGCFDHKHGPSIHCERRRSGPQEDRQGGPWEAGSDPDRGLHRSGWSCCRDRGRIPRQQRRPKCGRHDGPRSNGRLGGRPQVDDAVSSPSTLKGRCEAERAVARSEQTFIRPQTSSRKTPDGARSRRGALYPLDGKAPSRCS